MGNAFFVGEHELSLDQKNRVVVPSDVRKVMEKHGEGEAFYVTIGNNGRLWLYAEGYYETVLAKEQEALSADVELNPDPVRLAEWQQRFGMSTRLGWDKQFRILLPELLLRRTGTEREITMVGTRNHLQIWNRSDWAERHRELLRINAERAAAAARAQGNQGTSGRV